MLKQVLVSFCSCACLLVFEDYRKAFEIIGLESGCNEGKRDSVMNTRLVGEVF